MGNRKDPSQGSTRSGFRRPKTRRRRLAFTLITIGLSTVIAACLAEVALRLFIDQEAKRLATYDEILGWRGRPHGSGVYVRKIDNIRVPFHYNNLGFRDEDLGQKPPNVRRILMLGDSFIESLEVEYVKTFPVLLERYVKERSPDWEVAVVGSQGYSTSQELLAFRKFHDVISPDIVLLCFYCGNDFEDNLRSKFAFLNDAGKLEIPRSEAPKWKHTMRGLQRWLYESSHLAFLLKNSLESMANIRLEPDSKSATKADKAYMQEITRKLVTKLAEEVRATGAEFQVVVIPFRDDLMAGNQENTSFVGGVCADNNIPILDLSPLLDADDFFETDVHFNLDGHEVVANAINAFIASSLIKTKE